MDRERLSGYPDDLDELKRRLYEEECNTRKAAEIGQSLLEQNREIECQLYELRKSTEVKLEQAEQERYTLQNKYEQKVSSEEWYFEELNNLKQQLQDCKVNLRETLETEKAQEIAKLNKQIDELKADQEYASSREGELLQKVSQLEELIQDNIKNVDTQSNRSFDRNEELIQLYEEIEKVQSENTTLKAQLIERRSEAQVLSNDVENLQKRLIARDEELEDIRCQFTSINNALEEARMDKLDLKCQLDALQIEANHHNKKGNSIFSELDDRRVDAEKKVLSLQVMNTSLKEMYAVEKQQNQKFKRKISQLLMEACSGRADMDYVKQLESQLVKARQDLKTVIKEAEQLKQDPNLRPVSESSLELESSVNVPADKDYQQYLITLVKKTEDEKTKISQELKMKRIQHLDEQSKITRLESELKDVETEKQQLRSKNMRLCLKLEELQLKYEPDAVKKSGVLTVKKTEKIPTKDPADLKIKETCRNQTTGVGSLSQTMSQLSDTTLLETSVFETDNIPKSGVNLLDFVKKKKSVTIMDDAEVREIENINRSDEEKESETRPKQKGKAYAEVKYVKSEKVNKLNEVNECKQS